MDHSKQPHVEIIHTSDKIAGAADSLAKGIRAISASEAFRSYNWLRNVPRMNVAGNLRGMVVSSRWKTVFTVSSEVGEVVGKVALVVGFAANLVDSASRIEAISRSKNTWDTKGAMISAHVSSVAIRTLGGVIPATASVVFLSAQGYCQLGGLIAGAAAKGPQQCVKDMKAADAFVNSTFRKFTDGDNIYLWINTTVVGNTR